MIHHLMKICPLHGKQRFYNYVCPYCYRERIQKYIHTIQPRNQTFTQIRDSNSINVNSNRTTSSTNQQSTNRIDSNRIIFPRNRPRSITIDSPRIQQRSTSHSPRNISHRILQRSNSVDSHRIISPRIRQRSDSVDSSRITQRSNSVDSSRITQRSNSVDSPRIRQRSNSVDSHRITQTVDSTRIISPRITPRSNSVDSTRIISPRIRQRSHSVDSHRFRLQSNNHDSRRIISPRIRQRSNSVDSYRIRQHSNTTISSRTRQQSNSIISPRIRQLSDNHESFRIRYESSNNPRLNLSNSTESIRIRNEYSPRFNHQSNIINYPRNRHSLRSFYDTIPNSPISPLSPNISFNRRNQYLNSNITRTLRDIAEEDNRRIPDPRTFLIRGTDGRLQRYLIRRTSRTPNLSYQQQINTATTNSFEESIDDIIKNPIDKTTLKLKTSKFNINTISSSNIFKSCCICINEFINQEEVRILPCFHYFHTNCIDTWFESNNSCPLCKEIIN